MNITLSSASLPICVLFWNFVSLLYLVMMMLSTLVEEKNAERAQMQNYMLHVYAYSCSLENECDSHRLSEEVIIYRASEAPSCIIHFALISRACSQSAPTRCLRTWRIRHNFGELNYMRTIIGVLCHEEVMQVTLSIHFSLSNRVSFSCCCFKLPLLFSKRRFLPLYNFVSW